MGVRRKARELALQALYQIEMSGQPAEPAFEIFYNHFEVSKKSGPYARDLVVGVNEKWDAVNKVIGRHTENWRLERISLIDRNILRIAVYELLYQDEVPDRVAINEAIEIAKRYGTDESGAFINGILDAVCNCEGKENTSSNKNKLVE